MGYQVYPTPSSAIPANNIGLFIGTSYTGDPASINFNSGIARFNSSTTLSQGIYTATRFLDVAGNFYVGSFSTTGSIINVVVLTDGTTWGVDAPTKWSTSSAGNSAYNEYTTAKVNQVRFIDNKVWFAGIGKDIDMNSVGGGLRRGNNFQGSWTALNLVTSNREAYDVWKAGTTMYAIADPSRSVYTATNEITWTAAGSTNVLANYAMYDSVSGYHVGILNSQVGYVGVSTTGLAWSSRNAGGTLNARTIKKVGDFIVICAQSAGLSISTDALNWTQITSATHNTWTVTGRDTVWDIAYANPFYVIGTDYGTIARSTNMTTWEITQTPGSSIWQPGVSSITHDGVRFLAAGGANNATTSGIFYSSTGSNWQPMGAGLVQVNGGEFSHIIVYSSTGNNTFKYWNVKGNTADNAASRLFAYGVNTNAKTFSGSIPNQSATVVDKKNLTDKYV